MRLTRLSVFVLLVCVIAPAAEASIQSLGRFWVAGVSDDGNTVIGTGNDAAAGGGQVIVRWTPAAGLHTSGATAPDRAPTPASGPARPATSA